MFDQKLVSVVVSSSVAFTMPRITIEGKVDGHTLYTAEKTGDTWDFNLSGMKAKDAKLFLAIQEVMEQVHERVKQISDW